MTHSYPICWRCKNPVIFRATQQLFAKMDDDGEWIIFHGLDQARVPDLVQELVRMGGRVYAVELRQQTLEDRFLELLGAHSG